MESALVGLLITCIILAIVFGIIYVVLQVILPKLGGPFASIAWVVFYGLVAIVVLMKVVIPLLGMV